MPIPIANLYYLLSYAWQRLPEGELQHVGEDDSARLTNLFARLISSGFLELARRGLERGYVERVAELSALRGRGMWLESEVSQTRLRGKVVCAFEDLVEDTAANRVIKAALLRLLRDPALDRAIEGSPKTGPVITGILQVQG